MLAGSSFALNIPGQNSTLSVPALDFSSWPTAIYHYRDSHHSYTARSCSFLRAPLGAQHFQPCAAYGYRGSVAFYRKQTDFFLCEPSPLSGYMSSKRSFTPPLHWRLLSMQSSVIFRFVPINFSLSVYFLLSHVFPLASSLPSGEDKLKSYATALSRFQSVSMERRPQNCLICPL